MDKPPLLFIHGYRGNHEGLAEIANLFPDYEVHVPDIPPAGGNTFDEYDMPNYVTFITNYIDTHHLKKPILIGHSLGSIIASAVASTHPKLINEKIILLSPISAKPAKIFKSLAPLTAIIPPKVVDYLTTRFMFIPKDRVLFKKSLALTHAGSAASPRKDIFKSGTFSATHSIADFPFQKTTAIIVGEKDRLIPLVKTRQLANTLHAELTIIPNTGHIINYEAPDATAAAIRKFLES